MFHGHDMSMPIERKNSFHLMLSDDELALLRLLAEREGLNASDFLRTMLRRVAGPTPHVAALVRHGLREALGEETPAKVREKKSGG